MAVWLSYSRLLDNYILYTIFWSPAHISLHELQCLYPTHQWLVHWCFNTHSPRLRHWYHFKAHNEFRKWHVADETKLNWLLVFSWMKVVFVLNYAGPQPRFSSFDRDRFAHLLQLDLSAISSSYDIQKFGGRHLGVINLLHSFCCFCFGLSLCLWQQAAHGWSSPFVARHSSSQSLCERA